MGDCLGSAVRACPFLSRVGAAQGEEFAKRLAANPFSRAAGSPTPVLLEEGLSTPEEALSATLRLFHGPGGVVPLKRFQAPDAPVATPHSSAGSCPYAAAARAAAQQSSTSIAAQPTPAPPSTAAQPAAAPAAAATCGAAAAASEAAPTRRPAACAPPFASISLSGFGFTVSQGDWAVCAA